MGEVVLGQKIQQTVVLVINVYFSKHPRQFYGTTEGTNNVVMSAGSSRIMCDLTQLL